MNHCLKQIQRFLLLAGLITLGLESLASNADCARAPMGDARHAAEFREPRGDSTVSLTDPALDGMFSRYADLHRDAIGYAVSDVLSTSMFAKAAQEPATRLTR